MTVQLWQMLIIAAVALGGGGGVARLAQARSVNRRTDARTMAEAYGHVIDRLELEVSRQGAELSGLRDHVTVLLKMIAGRDEEIATLREELAAERTARIALEAKIGRRSTD